MTICKGGIRVRRFLTILLALCLMVPWAFAEETGDFFLPADAKARADYFHLIQNDDVLNIRVPEENPYFREIGGVLFDKSGKNLLLYPNGRQDKEYAVPEGVETIEEECSFGYGCQVERLLLPASFRGFNEANLFRTVIREFVVAEDNPHLTAVDGVLFTKDLKTLVAYPPGRTVAYYRVPDGTERIGEWAFCLNKHLTRVDMPDSLREIGSFAFDECQKLRSVRLPREMRTMGSFWYCYQLEELTLPQGIETIPEGALCCTSLTGALRIPDSVKSIGLEAFVVLRGVTDIYLPDGLAIIADQSRDQWAENEADNPLYSIYGWSDACIADYSVVMHAHEGTWGEELLESLGAGRFPYVITPVGVDAPDAAACARIVTDAMRRAGHENARLCDNREADWLPRRDLAACTLHEAAAVFQEKDRLLLCGFDDLDGEWTLRWVNDGLLSDGIVPIKLAYYGEQTLELMVPDRENDYDTWQYFFRASQGERVFSEAHLYLDGFSYLFEELQQWQNYGTSLADETVSTLRCAEPDEYDEDGFDENGNQLYTRTPGETSALLTVPSKSLRIEYFAGLYDLMDEEEE